MSQRINSVGLKLLVITLVMAAAQTGQPDALAVQARQGEVAEGTSGSNLAAGVGCEAEWHRPTVALVCRVGEELNVGVICPEAALYQDCLSPAEAAREQDALFETLRGRGVEILEVGRILMDHPDRLRTLAREALDYDVSRLSPELADDLVRSQEDLINRLDPETLWWIVRMRPTVHLEPSVIPNTRVTARYSFEPQMNLMFIRDSMIVTSQGVVLGRHNSEQRAHEVEIVAQAVAAIGIEPILRTEAPGTLEGGDFLMAGEIAFIGQGLRTNAEAIEQLLTHRAIGTREVVVVIDPWRRQEEMHLDTYFNLLGPRRAVMVEDRMDLFDSSGRPTRQADPKRAPVVDVYRLEGDRYVRVRASLRFDAYLRDKGFDLIPATRADREAYGLNFISVGENQIIGVEGQASDFLDKLRGVDATWVPLPNLTRAYGGVHCCTQILRREPPQP